ncbi:C4-type Zn finger protein, partial [mine drainage metagenome]
MDSENKDNGENLPVEIETNMECPVCSSKLTLVYYTTEISFERTIYLQSYFCKKCFYKKSEVM